MKTRKFKDIQTDIEEIKDTIDKIKNSPIPEQEKK